ncbi:hypothetical protein KAJ27_06335, partial [bacterium]|nr:hypothetical protein [bacterium]
MKNKFNTFFEYLKQAQGIKTDAFEEFQAISFEESNFPQFIIDSNKIIVSANENCTDFFKKSIIQT